MLKFLRFIITIILVVLTALPYTLFFMIRPTHPNNTWYFALIFRFISKYVFNISTTIDGLEIRNRQQACIFVSNHQHNLDLFAGSNACKKGTVSLGKTSILFIPIFGLIYYLSGNVLINRSNKIKANRTLIKIKERMKKYNHSIWIMAEGTRNPKPQLLPFKIGAFKTAIELQVPIVPVAIKTYKNDINLNALRNNSFHITFLPEIPTKDLKPEDSHQLKQQVQDLIQKKLDQLNATN